MLKSLSSDRPPKVKIDPTIPAKMTNPTRIAPMTIAVPTMPLPPPPPPEDGWYELEDDEE